MDAAMRSHRKMSEYTAQATGTNVSAKYQGTNKQICLHMSDEMFNIVKAEALRQETSLGEIVRQCLELVFK